MQLSNNQQEIVNEMLEFIFDLKGARFLKLNLIAGAGKSTIIHSLYEHFEEINHNADVLSQNYNPIDLKFTATTNTASEQLQGMGIPIVSTIHKLLGLTLKMDRRTGKLNLIKGRHTPSTDKTSIVIIDEASFIDDTLAHYIKQSGYRVILVGDSDQFLAIGNDTDEECDMGEPMKVITGEETFRFVDNKFADYVRTLKQDVANKIIRPIPNSVGKTLVSCNDDDYMDNLAYHFSHHPDKSLVVTFTNANVSEYEHSIRDMLGYSTLLTFVDKIIANAGVRRRMHYKADLSGNNSYTYLKPTYNESNECTELLDRIGIEYNLVKGAHTGSRLVLVKSAADIKKMDRYLIKRRQFNFLNEIRDKVAKVNYGYASTVHSAQGKSVKYLFIDFTDINKLSHTISKDTVARLKYVAISRASHKVFIRGAIPYQLLGNYAPAI